MGEIEELVMPNEFIESLIDLQAKTTIALSNYLGALYAEDWPALPPEVITRLRSTLSDPQRLIFFK